MSKTGGTDASEPYFKGKMGCHGVAVFPGRFIPEIFALRHFEKCLRKLTFVEAALTHQ
jgi:hypothetical protein